MSANGFQELEEMAVKREATARQLPPPAEHVNYLDQARQMDSICFGLLVTRNSENSDRCWRR